MYSYQYDRFSKQDREHDVTARGKVNREATDIEKGSIYSISCGGKDKTRPSGLVGGWLEAHLNGQVGTALNLHRRFPIYCNQTGLILHISAGL